MEFSWTPQQEGFRRKLRDMLSGGLLGGWNELAGFGPGAREVVDFSLRFCPALAERGLLVHHWPRAFGGAGGEPWQHLILGEELFAIGEPRGPQYMNVNWIGPALMKYGTDAQKAIHLPPIAGGTVIWCQGFSEPEAGSDLAALSTNAVRSGDGYIVNGIKIWTSYAHVADYCFLIARSGKRRSEVSVFLVPMDTPGVVVRPVKGIISDGHLNEVTLTDVMVDEASRLGEEGKGWEVVTYALSQERVGSPWYLYARKALMDAVDYLKARNRFGGGPVRERAARALGLCEGARMLAYRIVDYRAKGQPATAETNMAKWAMAGAERAVSDFILEFMPELVAGASVPFLATYFRRVIAAGIGSGAAEIQLNLVASRFLGLPKEA